ncbi:hypothetical protein Tco_0383078 [Tanacetum coccineum]
MSSPNHSTSDIEDAFSSMNILNYTSVSPDYFPASAGSRSFNSSKNSTDNMIPPVFSSVGLLITACEPGDVQQVFEMECVLTRLVPIPFFDELSCLLKEQLLEPALNLTVHCCGLEFRVLNGYDQKSFDEERGLN